ncbi:M20/M25/M40 family metallo-hydrolase [Chondromyces apiculatus]|uniref:Peptidase M28 domain-containing protein n=1 Tax=Chondromyces apiculatus DSM 436 TaxID=1192034 RepID=A0A017TDS7_9BACT|nr:M20/M25/M40 family metallo-hydrolase [Chondromyces apiculatus]EYF06965.1 Hypothetical protein CAP_1224 [Chondromyces apiculatus DSM 436]
MSSPPTPPSSSSASPPSLSTDGDLDELAWARDFIARVVAACPARASTSDDEARAHTLVEAEMKALGLATERQTFSWNQSLYESLALHFGLGTLGSLFTARAPRLAFALHAGTAASYLADSTRKAFVLRRLLGFRPSQNVLGTLPATTSAGPASSGPASSGPASSSTPTAPRLRIVFLAHVDAAYTGLIFHPEVASRAAGSRGPLAKPLRLATLALAGLAALDLLPPGVGSPRLRTAARVALTIPPLLSAAFNLDVSLRRQVVPGAMDDLSGVAALLLLARRLRAHKPDDVELVFVATGCEEAGLGGAQALCDAMKERWDPAHTVVIGVDSPANGTLRYYLEGEIVPVPLAPWLRDALERVSGSEPRFAEVKPFAIPVGGTDAIPFAVAGYPAVSLGCVDDRTGTPRHYHLPTDTPENLEPEAITLCLAYVERLVAEIGAHVRAST